MAVLVAVESAVLLLLALLVTGLLRSHAEILRQLNALGAGIDPEAGVELPVSLRPRGDVARARLPHHAVSPRAVGRTGPGAHLRRRAALDHPARRAKLTGG